MAPRQDIVVTTERLLLRPYELRHRDDMLQLTSSRETFPQAPNGPLDGEENWSRLLRHIGHWSVFGYGFFAVEEKDNGRFIGEAGLSMFRRDLRPDFETAPEATWSIVPAAQGKGYACEAASAALGWAEATHRLRRTLCLVHADNGPSLRVAEKLDFRRMETAMYKGRRFILFERIAG